MSDAETCPVDRIDPDAQGRWRVTTDIAVFEVDRRDGLMLWRPWVDQDVVYRLLAVESWPTAGDPEPLVFYYRRLGENTFVWDEVGQVESIVQVDSDDPWTAPPGELWLA